MWYYVTTIFILFVFYYSKNVATHIIKINRLSNLLNEIGAVCSSVEKAIEDIRSNRGYILDTSLYEKHSNDVRKLIPLMDKIDEFTSSWFTSRLEYSASNSTNLRSAYDIYNDLLTEYDILINRLNRVFNPKYAFRDTFLTPAKILNYFGIDLSTFPSRIFSLLSWILAVYSSEVKDFIYELIKNIFNT